MAPLNPNSRPEPSRPKFFWQAVWILLPVAVLVVVSLISLKQDERAAEQDARQRAAENVQSLALALRAPVDMELQRFLTLQQVWIIELRAAGQSSSVIKSTDLASSADIEKWERDFPGFNFTRLAVPDGKILADGRMVDPTDSSSAPTPPKWFRELTPAKKVLWEDLRSAQTSAEIKTRQNVFFASRPSAEAERAAQFLFMPPAKLIGDTGLLPTETGVSFQDLASYRLLSATNAALTDACFLPIRWRLINQPSFLSPRLLELTESLTNQAGSEYQQSFLGTELYRNAQSKTRAWLEAFRQAPDWPMSNNVASPTWTKDGAALAFFQPEPFDRAGYDASGQPLSGPGYQIHFIPRPVIGVILERALRQNQVFISDYVRTEVIVVGQPIILPGQLPGQLDELLSQAGQQTENSLAPEVIPYELKFRLTSRARMLASERRREYLFGALTLGALLAALTGCFAAWRSFRRQLQLNEMKSNFVSSVSHELRAPIASVRLMAENLERGKISEPQRQNEYFRFIVQECRRLSSLIENVLDFSRIEQNRKQYDFEPTDLIALTRQTVKLMEPYAAEKNVKLAVADLPAAAELNADGRALQQALVNLIDNAIKHSPANETVTVSIELKTVSRSPALNSQQKTLNLSVSDHGPGIPPAEHAKIFERFYRRGSELRRETQGVGIGLSIVKHIVEAHGGTVIVRSEPGQGSRFTIELPADNILR